MPFSTYDITLDSSTIKQVRNVNHNVNGAVAYAYGSGEAAPAATFQGNTEPSTSFQSTDLATLLALNTSTFVASGLTITSANVDFPFRVRTDGGIHASGSNHTTLRCSATTLVTPDSISATVTESATIDCTARYHGASPGSAPPCSEVTGVTIGSSATVTGEYILDSVILGGSAIGGVQSVTINPGITVISDPGVAFPKAYYITEVTPTVEVTTNNIDELTGVLDGAALGSGGVIVQLAHRASGGIVDPDATTSHIKITGATGMKMAATISSDERSTGSGTLRCSCLGLTAATGVAIT